MCYNGDRLFGKDKYDMDGNTTIEITNDKLEEAIKVYAAERNKENLSAVLNLLRPTRLLVPAMLKAPDQPTPCFLRNNEGEQFLAVYTSKTQIPKEPKSQAILSMPFPACNKMVVRPELQISGMVINPFSDNLVLKKALIEKLHEADEKATQSRQVKMTPAQFTVFVKKQVEFGVLPKRLFAEKETFVNRICDEKEAFVNEIFAEAFHEPKLYPYGENDYSVMALDIAEDMTLIRLDLPERDMAVPLCYRVYLTFNPLTGKCAYFTIEMTQQKDVRLLGGVGEDGKHIDYGEAPVEGAELQKIMDLARLAEDTSGLTS
jgi:hypothetical protein